MSNLFRERVDPVTGDSLRFSEQISWISQRIIRRWTFVIAYSLLTLLWLFFPRYFPDGLSGWNIWASYMALLIESVVGIGVFGISMRDHLMLKKIEASARVSEENGENLRRLHDELIAHVKVSEQRHDHALAHLVALMEHHGVEPPISTVERAVND